MNSSCFPKALIVGHPEMLSPKKLRRGDLVTDSILIHYLYAGIVVLNSQTIANIMIGIPTAIYQFVSEMTISTDMAWYPMTLMPPKVMQADPSSRFKSFEKRLRIVPVGVTS